MGTNTDTALHPWYVTGFVEGEGTFTYSRSGRLLALYFGVRLTAEDRPILEHIQAFFGGIGEIYTQRRRAPRPRGGFSKTASYYRVCRRDHLPRVIDHFDRYPLGGVKLECYRIWREMVFLKLANPRRPPLDELNRLAEELSRASPRNKPWN